MKRPLKYMIFIVMLLSASISCEETHPGDHLLQGVYVGPFQYPLSGGLAMYFDTVRLSLDQDEYTVSGKKPLSYGYGEWDLSPTGISFGDQLARNGMYTWEWILSGKYQYRLTGDSLLIWQIQTDGRRTEYHLLRKY